MDSVEGGSNDLTRMMQLIAADPAEFQRRVEVFEKAKAAADAAVALVGPANEIAALRLQADGDLTLAGDTLRDAKTKAAAVVSQAEGQAKAILQDAATNAKSTLAKAQAEADTLAKESTALFNSLHDQESALATATKAVEAREQAVDAKYASIDPDKQTYIDKAAAAVVAMEKAVLTTDAAEKVRQRLLDAVRQISKTLNGDFP